MTTQLSHHDRVSRAWYIVWKSGSTWKHHGYTQQSIAWLTTHLTAFKKENMIYFCPPVQNSACNMMTPQTPLPWSLCSHIYNTAAPNPRLCFCKCTPLPFCLHETRYYGALGHTHTHTQSSEIGPSILKIRWNVSALHLYTDYMNGVCWN